MAPEMRRFVAEHEIPPGWTPDRFRESLLRVAEEAHERGIRPLETVFSLERGRAFSLFEAKDAASVTAACIGAELPSPDVFEGERVYTELLDEPRRSRS